MLENVELEAQVIGTLLMANAVVDEVADIITADAFAEPLHGRIYHIIATEYGAGRDATPVTLIPFFKDDPALQDVGGVTYLAKLYGRAGIGNPVAMARDLARLARRRAMRDGLTRSASWCEDLTIDLASILDEADAALSEQSQTHVHQPTGGECIGEMMAMLESGESGVTSGIGSLDALLGPLKPKQQCILAARPGMGKTAVALSYAIGAARKGHGVLFVSLEMSSAELGSRMAADLCFDRDPIPYGVVRDGRLSKNQWAAILDARAQLDALPFSVIDAGTLTTGRLAMLVRSHARRMAARGQKLELVVIDYLQLLQPDRRGGSKYEAISDISTALKAMAKDQDVAVMALAQLSREVEKRPDKRPQLSDLRDSGQIEQDADAVLFLLREEYYLRQAEPESHDPNRPAWESELADVENQIEFILAKRRNGSTGKARGEFWGAYQAVRG